jgi:hypothetical protein
MTPTTVQVEVSKGCACHLDWFMKQPEWDVGHFPTRNLNSISLVLHVRAQHEKRESEQCAIGNQMKDGPPHPATRVIIRSCSLSLSVSRRVQNLPAAGQKSPAGFGYGALLPSSLASIIRLLASNRHSGQPPQPTTTSPTTMTTTRDRPRADSGAL